MNTFSQFRCILFAVIPFAACGGDKKSTRVDDVVEHAPAPMPAPTPAPEPAPVPMTKPAGPGFGDVAKPVANAEAKKPTDPAAVEHWIPTKASECIKLGRELAAKNDQVRARELFEAALKLDTKSSEAHLELARSYIATDSKALAIRHANKAVKLAPESSQAYNTLGRAELLRHDYDAAVIAFRQATELNANNVWAWNNLGLVHLTMKDYKAAVDALIEATTRKGVEGYMWNNLGIAYEQLDELDDARLAFENGAKLGSGAAKASRKRLEGVETIVVVKKPVAKDHTYETREAMPEVDGAEGSAQPETKPETKSETKPETKPEAPAVKSTTL